MLLFLISCEITFTETTDKLMCSDKVFAKLSVFNNILFYQYILKDFYRKK